MFACFCSHFFVRVYFVKYYYISVFLFTHTLYYTISSIWKWFNGILRLFVIGNIQIYTILQNMINILAISSSNIVFPFHFLVSFIALHFSLQRAIFPFARKNPCNSASGNTGSIVGWWQFKWCMYSFPGMHYVRAVVVEWSWATCWIWLLSDSELGWRIIMRCFSEWRTIPEKQRKIYEISNSSSTIIWRPAPNLTCSSVGRASD